MHACPQATILASELLNLHLRRRLEQDPTADLRCLFESNWVLKAFYEVTERGDVKKGGRPAIADPELQTTCALMPAFVAPARGSTVQVLNYAATSLAATAKTNVWMHFSSRVLAYTRLKHRISKEAYAALNADEKRQRKLEVKQMAADLCRSGSPSDPYKSPAARHAWVNSERARLGIDTAVGNWADKPLLFHLKARPERFLNVMRLMSLEAQANGGKALSLYPLRRSLVPRHARFDSDALRSILGLGRSDHAKEARKSANTGEPGSKRRKKEDRDAENKELFGGIVDLRAAGVRRRHLFDFAFTTDGVCARLSMRAKTATSTPTGRGGLTEMPNRGIWQVGTHTDRRCHTSAACEDGESHNRVLSPCDRRSIS